VLGRLRRRIARWLLEGLEELEVGGSTVKIDASSVTLASLTSDPTLAAGKLWFRSDLGQLRFSPDGSSAKQVYPALASTSSAIKAQNPDAIGGLLLLSDLLSAGLVTTGDVASLAASYGTPRAWAHVLATLSPSDGSTILKSSGLTADRTQAILYSMVDNGYYDEVLAAITADASDQTYSTSTSLSTGVNRYRSLSIASGVTLTLNAGPGVIIADTISNSGTIASGWVKGSGGSAGASGAGAGGAGRGALIILARNLTTGTVTADGASGGNGSTVAASGSGGAGTGGALLELVALPAGTGGTGGGAGGSGAKNAGGGGGYSTQKGGAAGAASVTTLGDARSLLVEILKAACDWWLVNVAGKTPTATKPFPSLGGSGGGGGAAYDGYCAGGGGGGGGGQVIIYATSLTAGTVSAKGGNGGNGGSEGTADAGGGGGGGGTVYIMYRKLSGTITIYVSGGAGGTGDAAGSAGSTGSYLITAV